MKYICTLLFLLGLSILSGCTTFSDKTYLDNKVVNVETFNSTYARIKFVNVKSSGEKTLIQGKVRRLRGVRGPIWGHIDVQVFAPDGASIYRDSLRYKKSTLLPRFARFSFEVTDSLSDGGTIRIDRKSVV